MEDEVRVELPEDLASKLIDVGFEEFFFFRGFLAEAGTVMTVASAGVAAGANMATILVARTEIGEFVAAVRDWVRRRTAANPDGELVIDVSARHGGEETHLRVKIESKNGTPELDTAALATFITSLFPSRAAEDAAPTSN